MTQTKNQTITFVCNLIALATTIISRFTQQKAWLLIGIACLLVAITMNLRMAKRTTKNDHDFAIHGQLHFTLNGLGVLAFIAIMVALLWV